MVNSIKLLVAVSILLFIIGIFMLGKRLRFFFSFESIKLRKSESFWILCTALILVLFTGISEYVKFESPASWVTPIGLLLFAGGVIFQFYVIKQRASFSLKKDLRYTIQGIYQKLRFPGYSALLLMLLGLSLIFYSLWALMILALLFVPALIYRITQEETALSDVDEDKFEVYCSVSKRLIPGLF